MQQPGRSLDKGAKEVYFLNGMPASGEQRYVVKILDLTAGKLGPTSSRVGGRCCQTTATTDVSM